MSRMWVAGGPGLRGPYQGTELSPVQAWHAGGTVQSMREGPVSVSVLGDCRVSTAVLYSEGLEAVRRGRWTDLTRWAGSYWVMASHRQQVFVAGDLAGVRGLRRADGRRPGVGVPGLTGRRRDGVGTGSAAADRTHRGRVRATSVEAQPEQRLTGQSVGSAARSRSPAAAGA